MALPRVNRLKSWRDFQAVYQHGIRHSSEHLNLRGLLEKESENVPRFGISISKKVSKKAVIRNRIKRQIRSAIREILPKIAPGWRIVVGVKPGATECKYEHFLRELKELLVKAKIINGY